jgi:hypothetical protein
VPVERSNVIVGTFPFFFFVALLLPFGKRLNCPD